MLKQMIMHRCLDDNIWHATDDEQIQILACASSMFLFPQIHLGFAAVLVSGIRHTQRWPR